MARSSLSRRSSRPSLSISSSSSSTATVASEASTDETEYESTDTESQLTSGAETLETERILSALQLPPQYYDADFDPIEYTLRSMPSASDPTKLAQHIEQELRAQSEKQSVVKKRLWTRILGSYDSFAQRMREIGELGQDLRDTTDLCHDTRSHLLQTRTELSQGVLTVISQERKRQVYRALLKTVRELREVQSTDAQLQGHLSQGHYAQAVLSAQRALSLLQPFPTLHAAHHLRLSLQSSLATTLQRVDEALAQVCRSASTAPTTTTTTTSTSIGTSSNVSTSTLGLSSSFPAEQYAEILRAYSLLSTPSRSVAAKIQKLFMESIGRNTKDVVYANVLRGNPADPVAIKKMSYSKLVTVLTEEHFFDCLLQLLSVLTDLIFGHYSLVLWHRQYDADVKKARLQEQQEQQQAKDSSDATKNNENSSNANTNNASNAHNNQNTGSSSTNTAGLNSHFVHEVGVLISRLPHLLWEEMERQVALLLSSSNMAAFVLDLFLRVLDAVNRFIELGHAFCGSDSPARSLRGSLTHQSKAYFYNFHKNQLDSLRMYLNSEVWHLMPVQHNFSIEHVKDLNSFLRADPPSSASSASSVSSASSSSSAGVTATSATSATSGGVSSASGSSSILMSRHYAAFQTEGNPFTHASWTQRNSQTSQEEAVEEEDIPDELRVDFVDDGAGNQGSDEKASSARNAPASSSSPSTHPDPASGSTAVLTITSHNVLLMMGKYLKMMHTLHPIAEQIFNGFTQFFEYYVYSLYCFFGTPREDSSSMSSATATLASSFTSSTSSSSSSSSSHSTSAASVPPTMGPQLQQSMQQIKMRVFAPHSRGAAGESGTASSSFSSGGGAAGKSATPLLQRAQAASHINLFSAADRYGVYQRAAGMESLLFVANSLYSLHDPILKSLPKSYHTKVQAFYNRSVAIVKPLRKYVYGFQAGLLIQLDPIPAMIANCRWDPKTPVGMQHNEYVEHLIKQFRQFAGHLNADSHGEKLSPHVCSILWEVAVQRTMLQLIEGFSRARRCNHGGRAQMSLDFNTFTSSLRGVCPLKPLPYQERVDAYIKAYYLSEIEILPWVKEHPEYTPSQLQAIVVCAGQDMKKGAKTALMGAVEDFFASPKSKLRL